MHDATAKLSSGLLNGNVNQFGDFDECLNVEVDGAMFKGKYCLAYFQPAVNKSLKFINHLRRLAQSHEAFKSTFDDVSMCWIFIRKDESDLSRLELPEPSDFRQII